MKITVLLLVILASPAFAQQTPEQKANQDRIFGPDEIGQAMAICQPHEIRVPQKTETQYPDEWKECYEVRNRWRQTDTARRAREKQEQLEKERAFIKGLVQPK